MMMFKNKAEVYCGCGGRAVAQTGRQHRQHFEINYDRVHTPEIYDVTQNFIKSHDWTVYILHIH